MTGWALNDPGPQRGPASPARLRAQQRSMAMSEKDNTVDYDVQPLVNLLNGALIEGYGNTDYSLFESSGLGHICRVSSGLAVPPRKTATLFAVSGDLLAAAAMVVRMHDSNCLSHPGDSRSIERLRELIAKVEQA